MRTPPLPLYHPVERHGILPITYFHALARLGYEGLIIVEPTDWFVSVGQFDNVPQIIDLAWCRANDIPVMRRAAGGGPVLLGPGQVFYNLVVKRKTRNLPASVADAYRFLSQAPIAAYRRLGLDVRLVPTNDLVTRADRKISGQGAADIEGSFCFIGNVMCEFDTGRMARVLKLKDAAVRAEVEAAMDEHLTWLARELATTPDPECINAALLQSFAELLGPVREQPLADDVLALAHELANALACDETLLLEQTRRHDAVKIREGVYVSLRGEW